MQAPTASMMSQPVPAQAQHMQTAVMSPPVAPASATPNAAPSSQRPGHPSFRRQRASRACETCHARKVRCDAASLGVPCTNCVAFSIECRIPAPKRKRNSIAKGEKPVRDAEDTNSAQDVPTPPPSTKPFHETALNQQTGDRVTPHSRGQEPVVGWQLETRFEKELRQKEDGTYDEVYNPKLSRAPIKEAGRVTFIGESSSIAVLVTDKSTDDSVHYPLPDEIRGTRARQTELDNVEIDILHQRGAFLLPPRALCDELVESFFQWIWPVVPVINKSSFMKRYRDTKNPPSLLLLQAMLLAGTRVCTNPQLLDANGSTTPAAMTFYKRAKALYDANYEDDRVTIIQALILMGWYFEGPEDITKNVFYWTRVAMAIAQGSGMHRSVESSQLSRNDKRLWKRIWWTLFTRDRSVAVALGRPCCVNTDDSDVEMLTEDDFIDDDIYRSGDPPPDPIHIQFFLNYVKLTEIMGLVLSQQYSVASRGRKTNALDLTASDMALADWLSNCSKEVVWDRHKHHFWAALLHVNYYTTLCLLHRAHMPPAASAAMQAGFPMEQAYPSRNIANQAAGIITQIIESLQAHEQISYAPAFIVYSIMSALIMHVYQMRSSNLTVKSTTEQRIRTCMAGLEEVSKNWLAAKMVHKLFESIIGNKHLEDRLQRAAGNRHKKTPVPAAKVSAPQSVRESTNKRKFGEMDDIELYGGDSAQHAPMSYERSRPQTPVATPSRDMGPTPGIPTIASSRINSRVGSRVGSPEMMRHDAFMGVSRANTRPGSPIHGYGMSRPATPPDLFLVTRDSPTLPLDFWNNFQPDQLFPADANISLPIFSPQQQTSLIDPALSQSSPAGQQQQAQQYAYSNQHAYNPTAHSNQGLDPSPHLYPTQPVHHSTSPHPPSMMSQQQQQQQGQQAQGQQPHVNDPRMWSQLQMDSHMMADVPAGQNEDAVSVNSSIGPIVPTTLNVEDWFQFFGIQGELHGGLNAARHSNVDMGMLSDFRG